MREASAARYASSVKRGARGIWAAAAAAGVGWLLACASLPVAPIDDDGDGDGAADAARADASTTPEAEAGDASVLDAGSADADADAAPVVLKRVSGNVDYGGPVVGATVTVLSPSPMTTTTDQAGDFFFDAPLGSSLVMKVVAPNLYPMIRGVVVGDVNRIRVFYLAGAPEEQAAQSLGLTFDPTKGITHVDFRNASVGGYGVTITKGGAPVTPGFGIALDATDTPRSSMVTLTGGGGSSLLLGDVAPGTVSFTPKLPDAGVTPCKPCDAPALPVQAGAVTWFDFECGSATDCQ